MEKKPYQTPVLEPLEPTDPRVLAAMATIPAERYVEDVTETHDRARALINIMKACAEELSRLECIPASDPDDVNALSAAKGFTQRALSYLERRFA